jgi:hypothetical protein
MHPTLRALLVCALLGAAGAANADARLAAITSKALQRKQTHRDAERAQALRETAARREAKAHRGEVMKTLKELDTPELRAALKATQQRIFLGEGRSHGDALVMTAKGVRKEKLAFSLSDSLFGGPPSQTSRRLWAHYLTPSQAAPYQPAKMRERVEEFVRAQTAKTAE